MTKIICVSDNHNNKPINIPDGDILIHAGDLTSLGSEEEIITGLDWLASLKPELKIFVPGNHDWGFQLFPEWARKECEKRNIVLLIDEEYRSHGISFYGSPWQPEFNNWAFNLKRGQQLKEKWDAIPRDTEVLITHTAPMNILDMPYKGFHIGCYDLFEAVQEIAPYLHIFGHIHYSHGVKPSLTTLSVNASLCAESYRCENPPVVVHF